MVSRGPAYSVCVFCGSRFGANPAYRAAAEATGRGIGERGWRLVYGGGEVGLMGVVARATLAAGGTVMGVIPRRLMEREVGKHDLTELVVTETMDARKRRMFTESDAYVTLPGGFGTLDELLEVVTLKQLGYLASPLLLVDVDGAWGKLTAALQHIVADGFAEPAGLDLWTTVADAAAALAVLDEVERRRCSDSAMAT